MSEALEYRLLPKSVVLIMLIWTLGYDSYSA